MILPPKTLAWRLLLWSGLLIYAVYKLRDTDVSEALVGIPRPLLPPHPIVAPPGDPPAIADLDALDRAFAAVSANTCDGHGTLNVRIGTIGLEAATWQGGGDLDCLAALTWAQAWPRSAQALEMERPAGR